MKSTKNICFFILLCLLFVGCAKKNTPPFTTTVLPMVVPEVPVANTPSYLMAIDSIHNQPWKWYYAKIDVNYNDFDKHFSFKTSVKCANDSATSALISFAKIPLFNSLITEDSVVYVNKKDRCYSDKSLLYLKKLLGVELSLNNLEEILLGLPLDFNLNNSFELVYTGDTIVLKSTKKKPINQDAKPLLYFYHFNVSNNSLVQERVLIESEATEIIIEFLERSTETGMSLPKRVLLKVTSPNKNLVLELTYEKTELNLPQEIFLTIPEDYEKCN